jgi:hypothetical protein
MNIAQIMDLDVGMKGITCSGKITWANEAKNLTGTSGGKDYDFWSQFIVIEDSSGGKIGVSIILEANQPSVGKGDMVTVEKAELKEYIKNGEPMLKLQGKLQYPAGQNTSQNTPTSPQPSAQPINSSQTQNNAPTWKVLDRELVEKDVICALLASRKRPEPKEVKVWVDYIMDGIHPDSKPQTQNNTGDEPPKPVDDDIPF